MDELISFLKTTCRLCGNQVKWKSDVADKQSFKLELWLRFQIKLWLMWTMMKFILLSYALRARGFYTGYEAPQTQRRFPSQSNHFHGEDIMIMTAIAKGKEQKLDVHRKRKQNNPAVR